MVITINKMERTYIMISVIIPTYRNPKCLDICLESALRTQEHQNEIIVIVDGYAEESAHLY